MTKPIDRRAFIATAPLAALCPQAVAATPSDPFLVHYHKWLEARRVWNSFANLKGNENWDFPESKAAEDAEDEAFMAMVAMVPISKEGYAGLAHVIWDNHGCRLRADHPEYEMEMDFPQNRLLLSLYRGLSGMDELPKI